MKKYYFIDDEIYFQNKKCPLRKVYVFNIDIDFDRKIWTGYDVDENLYKLNLNEYPIFIKEE